MHRAKGLTQTKSGGIVGQDAFAEYNGNDSETLQNPLANALVVEPEDYQKLNLYEQALKLLHLLHTV